MSSKFKAVHLDKGSKNIETKTVRSLLEKSANSAESMNHVASYLPDNHYGEEVDNVLSTLNMKSPDIDLYRFDMVNSDIGKELYVIEDSAYSILAGDHELVESTCASLNSMSPIDHISQRMSESLQNLSSYLDRL